MDDEALTKRSRWVRLSALAYALVELVAPVLTARERTFLDEYAHQEEAIAIADALEYAVERDVNVPESVLDEVRDVVGDPASRDFNHLTGPTLEGLWMNVRQLSHR